LVTARGAAAAGTFAVSVITGDADSGISTTRTYTHAVDFIGFNPELETGTTINGVAFYIGGATGPNYSLVAPVSWGMTGQNALQNHSVPSGPDTLHDLLQDFLHNSHSGLDQTLTLTGLTPGTAYATTFYNSGYSVILDDRVVTVTASDGGTITFDQNFTGEGMPSILRYEFVADAPSMTYVFDAADRNTFHHYGFTNEIIPEPATAALLGVAALGALRRRR
jgi:hypothetical protein